MDAKLPPIIHGSAEKLATGACSATGGRASAEGGGRKGTAGCKNKVIGAGLLRGS